MPDAQRSAGGFPVVGIIGGGQLARMCQPPAINLGIRLRLLAEGPDSSAGQVIPDTTVGDHRDTATVCDFAKLCDVVTFDHEHVPQAVLHELEAREIAIRPGSGALLHAQDKLAMRRRLSVLGVPSPRWAVVETPGDLVSFADTVGWPVVLKTPTGGYDGKGVLVVRSTEDLVAGEASAWFERPGALLAEESVTFRRELAVLVARSPTGQAAAWPVVETVQVDGVCREVIAPAPDLDRDLAVRLVETGLRIAGALGVVGVLAVEVFEITVPGEDGHPEPAYVVNELAMRPHNSGHWTIDGSMTGQFEQHLRAVLDLPLGETRSRATWTVMANVLGGEHPDLYRSYQHVLARDPGLRVHLYGKGVRAGRKVGHVTVVGEDLEDCRRRAQHAADYITGVIDA